MKRLVRTLTWFEKDGDDFVGEVELKGVHLEALQKLFNVSSDDPMYDCAPVREEHVEAIKQWTDVPIDLDRYAYFVECAATSATGPVLEPHGTNR